MIFLHSILAEQSAVAQLPLLVACFGGVLLLLAFIVGFTRGFRRTGWGGLAWLLACVAYVAVGATLSGTLSQTFATMNFSPQAANFYAALVLALVCVAVVLAVFGVMAIFLRPKVKWVKDEELELDEFGFEYEPEYVDYDAEEGFGPYGKRMQRTGFEQPTFGNRLFGGIACLTNMLMILFIVLSFGLFSVSATKLSEGALGGILENRTVIWFLQLAQNYALDCLCIGLVIVVGLKGYGNGFLSSLRTLIVAVGTLAAIVFSFVLPFTQYSLATDGIFYFLGKLVTRCANLLGGSETIKGFWGGRLLAGCCLMAFFAVLLVLLNLLLRYACRVVERKSGIKIVDGVLASVVYFLLGAVLCVAIWCVLYTVNYYGIFHVTEIVSEKSSLSNGLFDFAGSIMEPYIEKIDSLLKR